MASHISEYVENKLSMQDQYIDSEMMEVAEAMTRMALKAERVAAELLGLSQRAQGDRRVSYAVPQTRGYHPVVTSIW
jgi:hypothetical protein